MKVRRPNYCEWLALPEWERNRKMYSKYLKRHRKIVKQLQNLKLVED